MPKKPVEKLRVPLNCLIAPATKERLAQIKKTTGESFGKIVDRAAVSIQIASDPAEPKWTYVTLKPTDQLAGGWREITRQPLLRPSERKKK